MEQPGISVPLAMAETEETRSSRLNGVMKAIAAVPMFLGKATDLEFFIKRLDIIAEQMLNKPFDDSSSNFALGYFYSRIAEDIILELGIDVDVTWSTVKTMLRNKFGGKSKSIPRLTMREVLVPRDGTVTVSRYAKDVLIGFRKVKSRIRDAEPSKEKAQGKIEMLEELAQEVLVSNLPRRLKQWVRITKPNNLEEMVKVVEDEEDEEKEEKWDDFRRKSNRPPPQVQRGYRREAGWQVVERRNNERSTRPKPPAQQSRKPGERSKKEDFRNQSYGYPKWIPPRTGRCYQCREVGHFARECPWIYRRGEHQPPQRSYAEAAKQYRPEPMEVNAGNVDARSWCQESSTDEGSEHETGSPLRKGSRLLRKKPMEGSDKE